MAISTAFGSKWKRGCLVSSDKQLVPQSLNTFMQNEDGLKMHTHLLTDRSKDRAARLSAVQELSLPSRLDSVSAFQPVL